MLVTMSHAQVLAELNARWPENRIAPSLGRIAACMDLLGSPQRAAPVIQIAGTNGKGSTAVMIDALLRAQGLRTGRYTSPHLSDPCERIAVDGTAISPGRFDDTWADIAAYVGLVDQQLIDGCAMTAFEVITAMAFACFADAPVDVAVVEVGLGGSWDATNVADAAVAVLTPIALDHTEYLGDTIEQIAAEKAGIIKPGSQVVVAGQDPAAARVIMEQAARAGSLVLAEGIDFALLDRTPGVGGQILRLDVGGGAVGDLFLPLHGAAMAHNAALAVAAVEAFGGGRPLGPGVVEDGLALVEAPAHTELAHVSPPIVLDTCHNPAAVAATLATMNEAFAFAPQIAIWGMMADKAVRQVLSLLEPEVQLLIATQSSSPRALPAAELAAIAAEVFGPERVRIAADLPDAIDLAVQLADEAGPGAGIWVAGSVALAGEARRLLRTERFQPED